MFDIHRISYNTNLLFLRLRPGRPVSHSHPVRDTLHLYRVILDDGFRDHLVFRQILIQILSDFFAKRIPLNPCILNLES